MFKQVSEMTMTCSNKIVLLSYY